MSLKSQAVSLTSVGFTTQSTAKAGYLGEISLIERANTVLTHIDGAKRALIDMQNNLDSGDSNLAVVTAMLADIG